MGGNVVGNLERWGYPGDLYLVSRGRKTINGRPCVASIDELPLGIDVAVLIVPQSAVLDAVAACVRRKVGGAVVFASGFSEAGEEGRAMQQRLAAIAREGGLAVNGPNCLGFINYLDRIALTFETVDDCGELREPRGPGVAVIAQSGAMTSNIRTALEARGLPLTYAISTGNEAVVGAEDFLDAVVEDERTGVIAMFIEQIRQPQRFLDLVARARARKKPIIMMHPGRTERARHSTQSHTGALAGDHAVMRAVLGRRAVVVVDSLDELFDVTVLLARWPDPPTLGAAVLTNSGAFRGVALDFCDELGLDLPGLAPSTRETLVPIFPPFAAVENPLDLTTLGFSQPDIFGRAARVLLEDPAVGSLIVSLVAGPPPLQVAKAESLLPVIEASKKPVAFVIMGDEAPLVAELTTPVRRSGLPFFRSPDRAIRAMARVTAFGRALQSARPGAPAAALRGLPSLGSGVIPEYRGKAWLAAAGIRVPEGALAHSVEQAEEIAARIGYPVVMKAQAGELTHKSDVGGVIVDIPDAAALRTGWERLRQNMSFARPGLRLDGILVEAMAEKGLEIIIGARRDPDWGTVLMVGLGGVWIEALQDIRLLSPDLDEAEIISEFRKLKGARLLGGMRGTPPLDEIAIAKTVALVGELMRATPEVSEIDINPLVVYPSGKGVQALDALIVATLGMKGFEP